jgi:hypothetical protein
MPHRLTTSLPLYSDNLIVTASSCRQLSFSFFFSFENACEALLEILIFFFSVFVFINILHFSEKIGWLLPPLKKTVFKFVHNVLSFDVAVPTHYS